MQEDLNVNQVKDELEFVLQNSKTDRDIRDEPNEAIQEAVMSLQSPEMPGNKVHIYFQPTISDKKVMSSLEQAPKIELKTLPQHLKYVYLGENETLPVIIANNLTLLQEEKLLGVLKEYKKAIGWTLADIPGISPSICMHRILLEDDARPVREYQRKLNPAMKEVVMKEILKLLELGIIYPISDSQ